MPSNKKFNPRAIFVHDGDDIAGSGDVLAFTQVGKAETFYGSSWGWGYSAWGDAFDMHGRAHGGDDVMIGGQFVGLWSGSGDARPDDSIASLFGDGVTYAGDAREMSGYASGGNDTLVGGRDSLSHLMGDAMWMADSTKGGNDVVQFGPVDMSGTIPNFLEQSGGLEHLGLGDAFEMGGAARGGSDTITGSDATPPEWRGTESINLLAGDAWVMMDGAVGGADRITGGSATGAGGVEADNGGGGAVVENYMAGDTFYAVGGAVVFGKDVLTGGNANGLSGSAYVMNVMAGDQLANDTMEGGLRFGADTLYGGSGSGDGHVSNMLAGDSLDLGEDTSLASGAAAAFLRSAAPSAPAAGPVDEERVANIYSGDKLYGGNSHSDNQLLGDCVALLRGERGGNDLLVAGSGPDTFNTLVGDAYWIQAGATGGNDTLVSGMGEDHMWGDAYERDGAGGADTFVFGLNNGFDTIYDFQPRVDHIDLRGLRPDRFAPHNFAALQHQMMQVDDGVLIWLGHEAPGPVALEDGGDVIHILGVSLDDLVASTFMF